MITYHWEPISNLLQRPEFHALTRLHWEEIALDKDTVPLSVDWPRYEQMEDAKTWRIFVAEDDGKVIGYVSWFMGFHVRYKETWYCQGDFFFLHPDYRRGLIGYNLMKNAIAALPRPSKIVMTEKLHFKNARVGNLFKRLGMRPIERVHSMTLE